MRLTHHPIASAELTELARKFEAMLPGLGKTFLLEAGNCCELISNFPYRNIILPYDLRRMTMPSFPSAIYYYPFERSIRILAFKIHPRHPEHWRYRHPG